MTTPRTEEINERIKKTHLDCECCRNWTRITELKESEAHQAGIDDAVEDKRKLLEDFAEYAHTRYLGTDGKEYAYSQEVIYMVEDYLTIKALQDNK